MHQELIGRMTVDLEIGYLWLRRQIETETSEPLLLSKPLIARQWRMCKGEVAEAAFALRQTLSKPAAQAEQQTAVMSHVYSATSAWVWCKPFPPSAAGSKLQRRLSKA
jgi:hypothetical protein